MWRVTIGATNVIAPVLAAAKIVVLLFACMAGKTSLGSFFRRLVLEADYLCGVAFFGVGLARTMTRFTSGNFSFPTADLGLVRAWEV